MKNPQSTQATEPGIFDPNDPELWRQRTPEELRADLVEGAKFYGASHEHAEAFITHLTGEKPLSPQEMVRLIIDTNGDADRAGESA